RGMQELRADVHPHLGLAVFDPDLDAVPPRDGRALVGPLELAVVLGVDHGFSGRSKRARESDSPSRTSDPPTIWNRFALESASVNAFSRSIPSSQAIFVNASG